MRALSLLLITHTHTHTLSRGTAHTVGFCFVCFIGGGGGGGRILFLFSSAAAADEHASCLHLLHQVVFAQVRLQYRVFHRCEDELNVFRI